MNRLITPANRERTLSVIRFVFGLLYLHYGIAIVFGFPALAQFAGVVPYSRGWFAGVIELITGSLLVLGLFTRPAAFVASGTMAFGYFLVHAPRGFFPAANGGTAAIFACFGFLCLAMAGGGSWSLDALRARVRPLTR